MSDFKKKLDKQSESLVGSFSSLVSPLPVKFRLIKSWKEYVKNNSNISIACNMTFRDYIIDINPYHPLVDEHELIEEKNIVLPILHPYMIILVNIEELNMLKKLIFLDDNKVNISIDDFPFNINSN